MGNILVTGGAGYIGSVLVHQLIEAGENVVCLDSLEYGGESLLGVLGHPRFRLIHGDVRNRVDLERALGADVDAVVHLAAVVGDPACGREPERARAVNIEASRALLTMSRDSGVRSFVFASTCSNYGRMPNSDGYVDESTALNPISLYAETKVAFEEDLLDGGSASPDWAPTSLRFATVYGLSPRPRFDLTVNEFTREVALGRTLEVFGEQFWRPYCHVVDFAHAIRSVLVADGETVAHEVFNVGATDENYTKGMIVEELLKRFPDAKISFVKKDDDPRDYRVRFDKIRDQLGFTLTKSVSDGIDEIAEALRVGVVRDPDAQRYHNIPVVER